MLETAIAKLFCSEGLWQIADDCLQIWGGEGYLREHGIERMLRDARINRIVEGATEVMTAFVALIGMKSVGEEFEQVLRAGKHPINNFGRLAQFARSQWSDIVIGPRVSDVHSELAHEAHLLESLTQRLARCVSRLLRKYRQNILDMELLHQRIAWSAVEIYAMAAVISRLHTMLNARDGNGNGQGNGHCGFQRDLLLGKSFCHHAADRIKQRLDTLFANGDEEILRVADAVLQDPTIQITAPV